MKTIKDSQKLIVEKQLGIPSDYQYRAIRSKNFLQANWHRNKLFVVQKLLPFQKTNTLLDLGTGSGNLELTVAKYVHKIVGVDYNDEALAFLHKQLNKKNIHNVFLVESDIRDLKQIRTTDRFDYIIMIDTIEHIAIKEAEMLVRKMKKYLRANGKVFIITPNYHSLWLIMEWILDRMAILPKFANHQHLAKYTKNNLANLFIKHGYTVNALASFNFLSYLLPNSWLSKRVAFLETKLAIPLGNLLVGIFERKKSNALSVHQGRLNAAYKDKSISSKGS